MLRTTLLSLTLALSAGLSHAQAPAPLQMKVYQADEHSFAVTSTLITGAKEAVVVDSGFTRADGLRIAANVLDSGKQLTTILISNADPDYYFGAEVLKSLFPQAKVVATPAVREKIESKLQGKLAFWGPKMGANAPSHPVLPEALQGNTVMVDGQALELRGTTGPLAHRPYVWVPALQAIVGNVGVFGNLHVWTADTQRAPSARPGWRSWTRCRPSSPPWSCPATCRPARPWTPAPSPIHATISSVSRPPPPRRATAPS